MKKTLLTGIAALFLAIGATQQSAQARNDELNDRDANWIHASD
jgi:hypothetical protein